MALCCVFVFSELLVSQVLADSAAVHCLSTTCFALCPDFLLVLSKVVGLTQAPPLEPEVEVL